MKVVAVIAKHVFGRTGHESSRTIFGAAALGAVTQAQADATLDLCRTNGINHIDVAASYGDAELRLAPFLQAHRDEVFLATKTDGRTYDAAKRDIERSLERMGVDTIDLIQLHNLADPIQWDVALSPGGAIDACTQARAAGLVRFIGVTGHGSQIAATHVRSLERFDFDAVLLPFSYIMMQNAHYAETFEQLAAICRARNVALQTIKSIARSPWWGREHTSVTWYEPLIEQADIDAAVHWVLARPGVFLNTVGDIDLLPKVLEAAHRAGAAPEDAAMRALLERAQMTPLFV